MTSPRVFDASAVLAATPMAGLIDVIEDAFRRPPVAPPRHHHTMKVGPQDPDATLLLMPAWRSGALLGIKIATVFPGAGAMNMPAVQSTYFVSHGRTGELLAIMDGGMLTPRRTAATSGLAARYLAKKDAKTLLMVGTGVMSAHLIEAHCSVRPISSVFVWGRRADKAAAIVEKCRNMGIAARAVVDLEEAARSADVISCATLSERPLILGRWLRAGAHVDLVGGFKPTMREVDDECIRMSRVFVDTRDGALAEAGDLLQPIAAGVFSAERVVAELAELTSGARVGRSSETETTVFKSVGASLEDLAAAELVLRANGDAVGTPLI